MTTSPWLKYFTKPQPYQNQNEAMELIYKSLLNNKPIIFEGACGTGKTLSALAPALAVAEKQCKKVIIATSVKQQTKQFIEEATEIKRKSNINVIVLYGKSSMCPFLKNNESFDYDKCESLRDKSKQLYEKANSDELEELKDRLKRYDEDFLGVDGCPYMLYTLLADQNELDDFGIWLYEKVRDPQEVYQRAMNNGFCPCEMVRRYLSYAQLVICNYKYFLDEQLRGFIFGCMGGVGKPIGLSELIIIFDEAHNLESKAREEGTYKLKEDAVKAALVELDTDGAEAIRSLPKDWGEYLIEETRNLLKAVIAFMEEKTELLKNAKQKKIKWDNDVLGTHRRLRLFDQNIFINDLTERCERLHEKIRLAYDFGKVITKHKIERYGKTQGHSNILSIAAFLHRFIEIEKDKDPGYCPWMALENIENGQCFVIEQFCCIPHRVMKPIMDDAFGIVLMSATIQPFDEVSFALGITKNPETRIFPLTFPKDRRLTLSTGKYSLISRNRDDPNVKSDIMAILTTIIKGTPGNVLVVFPTLNEAKKYYNLYTNTKTDNLLLDDGKNTEDIKNHFFSIGKSGNKGILFTYMWGTLTEGVDFKNELLRAVVIIGVPYPLMNDENKVIRDSYENLYPGRGFDYSTAYPMIRRVRQTMGRVVRNSEDYGVRILIDSRYIRGSKCVLPLFPYDERNEIIYTRPDKVKEFLDTFFKNISKSQE